MMNCRVNNCSIHSTHRPAFPAATNTQWFPKSRIRCSAKDVQLAAAMEAARQNASQGLSPGAGLSSAEEQAEAAYADLINTSLEIDPNAGNISDEFVQQLQEGGTMQPDAQPKKKGGFFQDASELFKALSGGAHIVKKEDGRV